MTISGVFKLAGVSSIGGATLVVPTFHDAQQWYDRVGKTSVVYLSAQPGVSPAELKKHVEAVVPGNVKVQTGQENADQQTSDVEGATSFLTYILLAFAGAAVFVGLFIIFNTYSITVAQRMREFAMLRTLGASRRQVLRSVLLEAALMGAGRLADRDRLRRPARDRPERAVQGRRRRPADRGAHDPDRVRACSLPLARRPRRRARGLGRAGREGHARTADRRPSGGVRAAAGQACAVRPVHRRRDGNRSESA